MNNLKILIVEDELSLKEIYTKFLEKISDEVVFCDHPQKGWKAIDKDKFDLIITDLKMPIIEGDEFIKIIRNSKLNQNTPVILCSGHMDKKVLSELNRESKLYFLNKPFDSKTLLELVEKTQDRIFTPKVLVATECFDKVFDKIKSQIKITKTDQFDSNQIWNFDSILLSTTVKLDGQELSLNMLMQIKSFLNIAGKLHGTLYKELDEEVYSVWKDMIQKLDIGTGKVQFFKVRGLSFLDYEINHLKKVYIEQEELIFYLN